jgi:hypothetical protein
LCKIGVTISRSGGSWSVIDIEFTNTDCTYFTGNRLILGLSENECSNIPAPYDNDMSSVDPHGNCFLLCVDPGCSGDCVRVAPGTSNLKFLGSYNDRISSVTECRASTPQQQGTTTTVIINPAAEKRKLIMKLDT